MSKEKTFIQKLLTKLSDKGINLSGVIKMAAHALADGGQVYTEAEAPAVGDAVYADEALTEPVADGSYTLESGVTLVVEGGVITEIVEAVDVAKDDEEIEEVIEQMAEQITELRSQVQALTTKLSAATAEAKNLKTKLAAIKPASVKTEKAAEKQPLKFSNQTKGYSAAFDHILSTINDKKLN
jgi:regulator of replication initiation timing